MTEPNDDYLKRVDQALEGLARDYPADAPEALAQDTLDRVQDGVRDRVQDGVRGVQGAERSPDKVRDRNWASGLAAAVIAAAAVGIVYQPIQEQLQLYNRETLLDDGEFRSHDRRSRDRVTSSERGAASPSVVPPASPPASKVLGPAQIGAGVGGVMHGQTIGDEQSQIQSQTIEEVIVTGARLEEDARGEYAARESGRLDASDSRDAFEVPGASTSRFGELNWGYDFEQQVADLPGDGRGGRGGRGDRYREQQRQLQNDDAPIDLSPLMRGLASNAPVPDSAGEQAKKEKLRAEGESFADANKDAHRRGAQDAGHAHRFLANYRSLDGLSYTSPTGYWANGYLPGDPAMRRLEAQLRSKYPEALTTTLERNAQPLDAPDNAALGVYLHATQVAVDGPTRVQLQVGLKAAERQGGLRPPMNIAVVLDLPETLELASTQQLRALLLALNEQRQTGDRISITVAGVPGGTVVPASDFRHGTVVSFIESLADGELEGDTLDLIDAFIAGADRLAADDDPSAVLGSSLVMLVTADGIEQDAHDGLEVLAHSSAVAGMPVSVVSLAGVESSNLDALALRGQGRLRTLATPADAARLIDLELHSASRTVARAVRLRIQLAADVRLVDVIGSYRLNERDAERVREAEQSIDERLARNWGVDADRGEDEDGIQIVIPGMAAGETHVVLLDVVVNGPGDVADVRVRYKDLVAMRNGVARDSLTLVDADSARHAQGPLERNVQKNLLAFETAEAVRRSGQYLAAGDHAAARAELVQARALIAGLRMGVAGWENDVELKADEQRLAWFVQELDTGRTDMLVAALQYAAYRKLLPATQSVELK